MNVICKQVYRLNCDPYCDSDYDSDRDPDNLCSMLTGYYSPELMYTIQIMNGYECNGTDIFMR